jgi:hypothetical protein
VISLFPSSRLVTFAVIFTEATASILRVSSRERLLLSASYIPMGISLGTPALNILIKRKNIRSGKTIVISIKEGSRKIHLNSLSKTENSPLLILLSIEV